MALQGYGLRLHGKAPLCHGMAWIATLWHGKPEFRYGRAKHGYDHNRVGSVKHGHGIGCAAPISVASA